MSIEEYEDYKLKIELLLDNQFNCLVCRRERIAVVRTWLLCEHVLGNIEECEDHNKLLDYIKLYANIQEL